MSNIITGCYCADPVVLNLSPTPSTTVAELEGPTNITFNCDTYDGELTQVTTLWTYRLPSDSASSIIVNPEDHLEFVISGTTGNNSFPFPTFRNRLTIVNMTSRLDGVLLFCGGFRQGFNELASWTLRVYRELSHTAHVITHTFCTFEVTLHVPHPPRTSPAEWWSTGQGG